MGQTFSHGGVSVQLSDGLQDMMDNFLDKAVPTLRPAMEKMIQEAHAEVVAQWPDPKAREKFQRQRTVATEEAKEARRIKRMMTGSGKGISYWDFMPEPYRPAGWRSTGESKKAWRFIIDVEPGPVIVARLYNDARKGGAPYPYMAKHPPPHDTKRYWRMYGIPAMRKRERRLIQALSDDAAALMKGKR